MGLAERRWLRLITLCVLYVAQGIPWGFMAITLPAYISAKMAAKPEEIAVVAAMTSLAYALKWIWGPIIDVFSGSRFGRRRPWIIFAQGMMAATVISIIAIPDLRGDVKILAWVVLIHSVFNALQDVAVDALAIDLLDEAERARVNGFMYASKYVGGIIGGAGVAWLIKWTSLEVALVAQTAILGAIMMLPLLVRERDSAPPAAARTQSGLGHARNVLRSLASVFSLRSSMVTAALMLCLTTAQGIIYIVGTTLFTQKLHWSQESYTSLSGGIELAGGFGGAIVGGFLAERFGRRRVIGLASIAAGVCWAVFGASQDLWTNVVFVYAIAIVVGVLITMMIVGTFALCMDVSWSQIGASQFAAYMAMSNFSSTIGNIIGGKITATLGYANCYFLAAALQIVVPVLLVFIDPHETRSAGLVVGEPAPRRGVIALSVLAAVFIGFTVYVVRGLV